MIMIDNANSRTREGDFVYPFQCISFINGKMESYIPLIFLNLIYNNVLEAISPM